MGCYACFVGFNGQALGRNGCIDCCMASLGCCWCVTMDQRIAVRAKYGLVENMDCLASYVFCCCAVCQHNNEMNKHGDGNFWGAG